MNRPRRSVVAVALVLAMAVATDASAARPSRSGGHSGAHSGGHAAHHGTYGGRYPGGGRYAPRYRAGIYIGAPFLAPFYYYPPPYYYYPAPIMAPGEPTYIEQYPGQSAPDPSSYWYFCASSNAYYPYVRDCPEGWQPVAPQPPS